MNNKEQKKNFVNLNKKIVNNNNDDLICKKYLPLKKEQLNCICSSGGVGKTTLALILAIYFILEEKHDHKRDSKVLFLATEDPEKKIIELFNNITDNLLKLSDEDKNYVIENLHIQDSGEVIPKFLENDKNNNLVETKEYKEFVNETITDYSFLILDPLIEFYSACGLDENNNSHSRRFMNLFARITNRMKKTILFLVHTSQSNGETPRGATAFMDAFRLCLSISKYKKKLIKENPDTKKNVEEKDLNGNTIYINDEEKKHKRVIKIIKDNSNLEDYLKKNEKYFIFPYFDVYNIFEIQIHNKEENIIPEINTKPKSLENEFCINLTKEIYENKRDLTLEDFDDLFN